MNDASSVSEISYPVEYLHSEDDGVFNVEKHLIPFLNKNPFFAEVSVNIRKYATFDQRVPTAMVSFNLITKEIVMAYNPEWLGRQKPYQIQGVLAHEFYHVVLGHLNNRVFPLRLLGNIATDCANNSMIVEYTQVPKGEEALPQEGIIPGRKPDWPDEPIIIKTTEAQQAAGYPAEIRYEKTPEQKAALEVFGDVIKNLPKLRSSEEYYSILYDIAKREKSKQDKNKGNKGVPIPGQGGAPGPGTQPPGSDSMPPGSGGTIWDDLLADDQQQTGNSTGTMDNHDFWDQVPDDMKDMLKNKIEQIVKNAVQRADQQQQGWGNIPSELQHAIRKSVESVVDWRAVLKQFVGSISRGERSTSIKKINRRYPYVHPGVRKGYTVKLLIAMDQSGSVDDEQLTAFFAELTSLTRQVDVDILPFDAGCRENEIFTWKKGTNPDIPRTRTGGTDFNAPTRLANDPKNRGRWDGMLILSDGECGKPEASRLKRGWIISKGKKLLFETNELVIQLDNNASTMKKGVVF